MPAVKRRSTACLHVPSPPAGRQRQEAWVALLREYCTPAGMAGVARRSSLQTQGRAPGLASPSTPSPSARPCCPQLGGSRERAPGQIDFLRNNDVPADMVVVRLKFLFACYCFLTGGGHGCGCVGRRPSKPARVPTLRPPCSRGRRCCTYERLTASTEPNTPPPPPLHVSPTPQSFPRQVGPSYFSDRVPTISPEQSAELVAALTQLGGLNATGYTVPGVWAFDGAVAQLPWLAADPLVQGAVVQQLRIAAGDHENMGGLLLLLLPIAPLRCGLPARGLGGAVEGRKAELGRGWQAFALQGKDGLKE